MIFIQNKKIQVDLPDPFTKDEMNRLLDWLQTNKTDKESLYCWYYLFHKPNLKPNKDIGYMLCIYSMAY